MVEVKESGKRIRQFFNAEANALLNAYLHIQTLLPAQHTGGSSHHPEEGRHIESLLRSFLNRHLPRQLRAFSGFILRPATKTNLHNRRRLREGDLHSSQLDIIVFDVINYPIYEHFEEFVIVPPEGVIAIVSVKKKLYRSHISQEIKQLASAAALCGHTKSGKPNVWVRGPSLVLWAFSSGDLPKADDDVVSYFMKELESYASCPFDQLINQITILDRLTLFKARPSPPTEKVTTAKYVWGKHPVDSDSINRGLQTLLTSILSVFYDETRSTKSRPGFTSFPPRESLSSAGEISVKGLRVTHPKLCPTQRAADTATP